MSECFDDGRLRAYLDHALPELEQATIAHHLSDCAQCRRELAALNKNAQQAELLLTPMAAPDPQAAFARFQTVRPIADMQNTNGGEVVEQRMNRLRRPWFAALGAVLVMAALFALPPVRAAADSLLQIFRVQQVMFVSVSEERMQQLKDLNFDGDNLFLSKPDFKGDKPQQVADAAVASSAAGFTIAEPNGLPSAASSSEYAVVAAQNGSFQVNVESARQLMSLLDVKDVTLPDALGQQPITVSTKPIVSAKYSGTGYNLTLTQGNSPEVALPDGVKLSQLGSALLQVLGTPADQAKTMADKIDWTSTLVVPIPADINAVQQTSVNGLPAMLIRESKQGDDRSAIYWQRGDRFFVIEASGLDDSELIAAAESVK